jgi:hypothetical protein
MRTWIITIICILDWVWLGKFFLGKNVCVTLEREGEYGRSSWFFVDLFNSIYNMRAR